MLQSLNHLTLAVSDLQKSLTFWHDLLGLTLHASWDSGAYLTCGDLWLCLSYDEARRVVLPQESDYTHYAFSVAEQDFVLFSHKLEQAGVTVWKQNKSEGASFYFLDPDGHKLELQRGQPRRAAGGVSGKPLRRNDVLSAGLILRHLKLGDRQRLIPGRGKQRGKPLRYATGVQIPGYRALRFCSIRRAWP